MLTKEQEQKLWQIKTSAYDYYGARFDGEALALTETIQQLVDNVLKNHNLDPMVLLP